MRLRLAVLALVGLVVCGCQSSSDPGSTPDQMVSASGQINYYDLEGGFYGIVGEDGSHWLPTNLPAEYRRDNLHVQFQARITDLPNSMMWGRTVEIVSIAERN